MAEAKAAGYLELNIAGFQEAAAAAQKILGGLAATFAAVKTIDFWKTGIEGAIKFGDEAYKAGQKMGGFDPGKLYLVQKAFMSIGISAEEANSQISEMIASHRDFSQVFHSKADYSSALQGAQKNYGSEANVLSKSAEQFSRIQGTLGSIGEKLQTFFAAMTSEFLGPLYAVLNALNQVDLAGAGAALGSAVDKVANTLIGLFAQGNLISAFTNGLIVAAETFVNYMSGGVESIANALGSLIKNIDWLKMFGGLAEAIIGAFGKFGAFLLKTLLNIGTYFGAALATVIQSALAKLAPAINAMIAALAKVFHGLRGFKMEVHEGSFKENLGTAQEGFKGAFNYADSVSGMGQKMVDAGVGSVVAAVGKVKVDFKQSDLFVDLSERSKHLSDAFKSANAAGEALGKIPAKIKGNFSALGAQEGYHVIADSLAKVGGSSGYIRSSMTIAERESMKQTEIQRQLLDVNKAILKSNKAGGSQPMARE